MKIQFTVKTMAARLKTSLSLWLGVALLSTAGQTHAASAAWLLERGIYMEETRGDIKTATELYRQIVDDSRADRRVIAQAQLRLGLCQLKLGNKTQAITALDRLTQEFPDKDKLLEIVEQQMPQVLDEIVQQIQRNYIQEVDRSELIETAIRAIVGKLDSHGGFLRTNDMEFLGVSQVKQFNEQLDQKIAGVGAVLKTNGGGDVVVQSTLPGSPAFEGGIRAGDRIMTIDGSALPSNQLAAAVQRLRGAVGTVVSVGVKRADPEVMREFTLVRNTIRLPSVLGNRRKPDNSWDFMLDDQRKIGYLRLVQIGRQSADEMHSALDDLTARGMKGLILDLRNNPGGLLDGAVAISDLFVEAGRIVTVKGRDGEQTFDAGAQGTFSGFPIALLVNQKTASAAEIVAACMQDHHRAVVIGERTFGQGIVRSIIHLKSGVGAMKLPVAAYYRPSGKSMNRYPDSRDSDDWGVSPNAGYEVALTDEESRQYEKDRAAQDALNHDAPQNPEFRDRPLQKAIEYVRAQLRAN